MSVYLDYDRYASEYEDNYTSDECIEENEIIRDHFLALHSDFKNKRILDLGTGTGFLLDLAGKRIHQAYFTGIDISTEMLDVAANKYPSGRFIADDAERAVREISASEQVADVVFSAFSIPYIRVGAIEAVYDVLKVGGIFITAFYDRPYLNPASVYSGQVDHYHQDVLPQVNRCIERAENLFSTEYKAPLTATGAYKIAIYRKHT